MADETRPDAIDFVVADDDCSAPSGGFEQFLREQRDALVGFLSRRTECREDAEDVAQESFARLMRYRESQPHEAWKPLLYRIASNVVSDQARLAQTRRADRHGAFEDELVEIAAESPEHDERVAHEQELAAIREAILQLPPRCQQVYLLNRLDGMSYSQVARHLGISVKAVEKHIAKALTALRGKLDARAFGTA